MQNFSWERLIQVTEDDPLRILSSACLLGHRVGWDDRPYTSSLALTLAHNSKVSMIHFCPEDLILGTPRLLTTIHGGNGFDVLDGRASVRDTEGNDHTDLFVYAAEQFLEFAQENRIELALLTEISDSCGSTALYIGAAQDKNYQKGAGVSAALLMRHSIPVIGSQDLRSIQEILCVLDPTFKREQGMQDFTEISWYSEYFSE